VLSASPVLAEITAEDVWNSWQTLAGSYNQKIVVESENFADGVLTLTGVTTTLELPDGGVATGEISEMVLTEQGDGTVSMTMPDEYPFTFEAEGSEGEDVAMSMRFLQEGLDLVASGDPEAISYDFSAPSMSIVLDEMTENGRPVDMTLNAVMSGTDGSYTVEGGEPQKIASGFTADSLDIEVAINEPEENVDFDMTLAISDVASTSTGAITPFASGADLAAMLKAGFEGKGRMTSGASTFEIRASDGETPFTLTGGSESGTLDVAMGSDGAVYESTNTGISSILELENMGMPPFELDIAETSGELRMPLIVTEEPRDFGLVVDVNGLSLGESVWAMIDPMGGLPRDPANLELDLSGEGRWKVDFSDPDAMTAMTDEVPGEVNSLSLNKLLLSFLGAELTGSGDFSFDNATAPPAPAGLVNLKLVGANALIDKLIETGLMPEEQAMGARMMLGLFAQPGSGPDELTSTIELKDDGSVLANGQRIR
jgi:hypothetical protein